MLSPGPAGPAPSQPPGGDKNLQTRSHLWVAQGMTLGPELWHHLGTGGKLRSLGRHQDLLSHNLGEAGLGLQAVPGISRTC